MADLYYLKFISCRKKEIQEPQSEILIPLIL